MGRSGCERLPAVCDLGFFQEYNTVVVRTFLWASTVGRTFATQRGPQERTIQ
jgi:hypothetical protein